jgi:hypothetical protein
MQPNIVHHQHVVYKSTHIHLPLFRPLVLQSNCLPIHKDALALVRLRLPPHSDLSRKLHDNLLLRALE